jgi:hypothetical protein
MRSAIIVVLLSCRMVGLHLLFGITYYFHHQCRRVRQANLKRAVSKALTCCTLVWHFDSDDGASTFSGGSVNFYKNVRYYIQEYVAFHSHHRRNLGMLHILDPISNTLNCFWLNPYTYALDARISSNGRKCISREISGHEQNGQILCLLIGNRTKRLVKKVSINSPGLLKSKTS